MSWILPPVGVDRSETSVTPQVPDTGGGVDTFWAGLVAESPAQLTNAVDLVWSTGDDRHGCENRAGSKRRGDEGDEKTPSADHREP